MNRKRHERDKTNAVTKLNGRHIKLLVALERYGKSDINHLKLLIGSPTTWNIDDQLRELFDTGLVDKLNNKLHGRDTTTDPDIYSKNKAGTDWLKDNNLLPYHAIWSAAGGNAPHNLKVVLALQTIEAAVTEAGLRFITWEELLLDAPEPTKKLKAPWRFPLRYEPENNDDTKPTIYHIVPDGIFSVATLDDYHRIFFFELDLSDHGDPAYEAKAKLYHDLIFKGIYKRHLGITQWATILTMTTNQSRLLALANATPKNDPSVLKLTPQYAAIAKAPKPDPYILQGWIDPSHPTKPTSLLDIIREEVN
jgi:hypothetical protein